MFSLWRRASIWQYRPYTIPLEGGEPVALPVDRGGYLSFGPDGHSFAFNRIFSDFRTWKRYDGGLAQGEYDDRYQDLCNVSPSPIPSKLLESSVRQDQGEEAHRWYEMCETLAPFHKGHKHGKNQKRQSDKRHEVRGWQQQRRRAREFQTCCQEAPPSGIAPASEVGLHVADIEEVDEPRTGERQRGDAVHNQVG